MNGTLGLKVYNRLKKIRDRMDKVIEHLIVGLLVLLVATITFQVLYRFVIVKFVAFSFPFTEEIAIYSMVWGTYLAMGVCLKEGMHSSVNILADRFTGLKKYILYFVLRILMLFFIFFVIYNGANLAFNSFIFKTPTLQIPMAFIYLAPVVGMALMLFQIIVEFMGLVFNNEDPFAIKIEGGA